ncbi:LysR substrate-binding domain-containing protein [Spiribacter halobius]|uniref:Transcriptional regulator n=1 Tax=Sediminicurvatus halobius TaxID=2182432 RepID=A0A2U2MY13_9GAMM|nr:LysR substrate-binding domain-containing protein [Spiribacter halobius]PWG61836.1 transcriptional regulator [Spiribacter halobius]UEX77679.1 LysR family transcriptional regulator [Spiribacter halobius]
MNEIDDKHASDTMSPDHRGQLPPFPALRAFHAAARTRHFGRAADLLHLTQSAVSHQVRQLEEYLGTRLFERGSRGVTLTDAGRRYFAAVDPAIERIREATRELRGPAGTRRVSLTTLPSVVAMWLIPNWRGFEEACPGIELQFLTTTRVVDLRGERVDLAMRYGAGHWPDVDAELLFQERLLPVARPGDIAEEARSDPQAVLEGQRLIVNDTDDDEWRRWAEANALPAPNLEGALHFADSHHVLQAVQNGLGLGMGRRPLVDGHLRAEVLEAAFPGAEAPSDGCYLCHAGGRVLPEPVARVQAWLHHLAVSSADEGSGTGDR